MSRLREEWGPGPWDYEPDHEDLVSFGYKIEIKRNMTMGSLLAYLEIPWWHPLHAADPAEVDRVVRVHGGVTFDSFDPPGKIVVRRAQTVGRSGRARVVGWDHAHAGDLSPWESGNMRVQHGSVYRDWTYVTLEAVSAAAHLRRHALDHPLETLLAHAEHAEQEQEKENS